MAKEVGSDGWTGRKSGEPDGAPAAAGSRAVLADMRPYPFGWALVAWFYAAKIAGYGSEATFVCSCLGIFWLSRRFLSRTHGLWRHHVKGDRDPTIIATWNVAMILVTGILFLLVVIERQIKASP